LLFLTIAGSVAYAEEAKQFNPANVTEAATHLELMPEYNKLKDGEAYIIRLLYDYDWAEGKYSVSAEIPYGKLRLDDGTKEEGIGDIRTRFFWKFYDAPGSRLENIVFNLDVFLPTGDSSKGLGLGTFQIVPNLIFALPVSESFIIYPAVKYKFTTSETEGRSSAFPPGRTPILEREEEEYINAIEVEMVFVYSWLEANAWMYIQPIYEIDLLPEAGEDNYELTLRGQVGKMFGRWGLGLEGTTFVAGEKTQEYQLKGILFYYF
jgi:hypothetical protein